jgi:hypothetical protein
MVLLKIIATGKRGSAKHFARKGKKDDSEDGRNLSATLPYGLTPGTSSRIR